MSNENSKRQFSKISSSEASSATGSESSQSMSNESNQPQTNNYSNEVNSLFSKLQNNSRSSNNQSSSIAANTQNGNILSSSANDDYLDEISSNASSTNVYFDKINSISSNVVQSSASISAISNKINVLNGQIGLNEITIPDNEAINKAAQSVAINIIKVNNQKIKVLTAKNGISGMSFRVRFDYQNYLKAKRAIETDVTGINTHMSNSHIAFNQGINTLNSHNSLITSYANQLSYDTSNASKGVDSASQAAAMAASEQSAASTAYGHVHSLANHLNQQVANIARSNATTANLIASQAASLNSSADSYNQQIISISHSYSNDASITSANSVVSANLDIINSNNQQINNTASDAINEINQIGVNNNVMSLGTGFLHASKAATQTSVYKSTIASAISNIASATSAAKSVAASLHARRVALNDGANDYMPISNMTSLNTENNTATYIKYYKQGYKSAKLGFHKHLEQLLSGESTHAGNADHAYQIGFKNAGRFVQGINDARKRVIKNDKEADSKHYNYGYSSCNKLVHNSLFTEDKDTSNSLKQSLLLVIGFLIGSYN